MIADGWFRAPSIISANRPKNPAVDYIPEPVIAFKTGGILLLNINAQTIAYLQKIIAGRIMGGSDMVDVMLLIGKKFRNLSLPGSVNGRINETHRGGKGRAA